MIMNQTRFRNHQETPARLLYFANETTETEENTCSIANRRNVRNIVIHHLEDVNISACSDGSSSDGNEQYCSPRN